MKKAATLHSRENQIAELTRGITLPLAPVHYFHLMIIAETLSRAWNDLLTSQCSAVSSGCEREINALMESRLNHILEEEGTPLSTLVSSVTRGKETISYDGKILDGRPDISIQLTGRNRLFPLIVECKIIDKRLKKGRELYCKEGVSRFIEGKYAWATCEAFMLAYVRDGSCIRSSLMPFFNLRHQQEPTQYLIEAMLEPIDCSGLDLSRSRHGRNFRYVGQAADIVPGSIDVWHLWVPTPSSDVETPP